MSNVYRRCKKSAVSSKLCLLPAEKLQAHILDLASGSFELHGEVVSTKSRVPAVHACEIVTETYEKNVKHPEKTSL